MRVNRLEAHCRGEEGEDLCVRLKICVSEHLCVACLVEEMKRRQTSDAAECAVPATQRRAVRGLDASQQCRNMIACLQHIRVVPSARAGEFCEAQRVVEVVQDARELGADILRRAPRVGNLEKQENNMQVCGPVDK